jgi:HEAT repeat protein
VALEAPQAAWLRLGFKVPVMRAIVVGSYELAALRIRDCMETNSEVHFFLANQGVNTRSALVDSLGALGAPGYQVLRNMALTDKDFLIRCQAAKWLADFGAQGQNVLMLMANKDKDYAVRRRAAEVLEKINGA